MVWLKILLIPVVKSCFASSVCKVLESSRIPGDEQDTHSRSANTLPTANATLGNPNSSIVAIQQSIDGSSASCKC